MNGLRCVLPVRWVDFSRFDFRGRLSCRVARAFQGDDHFRTREHAMAWLTTATVLQRLRDFENRDAWGAFAERFRQPVVSFARGMGLKGPDAEDVAQETLLAFAEAYRDG